MITLQEMAVFIIEKHQGPFTHQSLRPLQGNGIAAISKTKGPKIYAIPSNFAILSVGFPLLYKRVLLL